MPDQFATQHLAPDTLADYFALQLPEAQELEVEEHLAVCDQCAERARVGLAFDAAWDTWTAAAHGEAARAAAAEQTESLARALEAAEREAADPAWRARLARWRERAAGRAEAMVKVVVETTGAATRVVAESLDVLGRPGAWQLAPAPVPVRRIRGLDEADEAAPPSSAPLAPRAAALSGPPPPPARPAPTTVSVSAAQRDVVVRVDAPPPGETLVLLLPTREQRPIPGAAPRLAALEPEPAGRRATARFRDVEPGEYLAVFEPTEEG